MAFHFLYTLHISILATYTNTFIFSSDTLTIKQLIYQSKRIKGTFAICNSSHRTRTLSRFCIKSLKSPNSVGTIKTQLISLKNLLTDESGVYHLSQVVVCIISLYWYICYCYKHAIYTNGAVVGSCHLNLYLMYMPWDFISV